MLKYNKWEDNVGRLVTERSKVPTSGTGVGLPSALGCKDPWLPLVLSFFWYSEFTFCSWDFPRAFSVLWFSSCALLESPRGLEGFSKVTVLSESITICLLGSTEKLILFQFCFSHSASSGDRLLVSGVKDDFWVSFSRFSWLDNNLFTTSFSSSVLGRYLGDSSNLPSSVNSKATRRSPFTK